MAAVIHAVAAWARPPLYRITGHYPIISSADVCSRRPTLFAKVEQ
jgi:hypothetical protein